MKVLWRTVNMKGRCIAAFLALVAAIAAKRAAHNTEVILAGKTQFEARCAGCHGANGEGGEHGPNMVDSRHPRARSPEGLREIIRSGILDAGMPASRIPLRMISRRPSGDRARGWRESTILGPCSPPSPFAPWQPAHRASNCVLPARMTSVLCAARLAAMAATSARKAAMQRPFMFTVLQRTFMPTRRSEDREQWSHAQTGCC